MREMDTNCAALDRLDRGHGSYSLHSNSVFREKPYMGVI